MGTDTGEAGASPHFSDNYRRDRLSNWLILSLERAGRREEIIPLCRQEAERTGSYLRLVERLKKAKRWEEAEQWIRKWIAATEKHWPGIAGQLRASFIEMRKREQDWTRVAALRANDFSRSQACRHFRHFRHCSKRRSEPVSCRQFVLPPCTTLKPGRFPKIQLLPGHCLMAD